jgi:RNA polymerase sigma-70 factor (ECF subfamily)
MANQLIINLNEYEREDNLGIEELARLAAQGDTGKLYSLCQRIARGVLFHTTHILGNQADAEDVSQEVLLRVCEKIGGLRDPATFSAWLGKIVTNETNRYLTRNLKRGVVLNIEDYLTNIAEENADFLPHEYAENEELREFVVQTIDCLPVRQREAVLLHYYNGLSVSDTAKTMGMSQAGVSQYLALARKRLKRELERNPSVYGGEMGPVGLGALMSAAIMRHFEDFRLPENAWMQRTMARISAYLEEAPRVAAPKPPAATISKGGSQKPALKIAAAGLVSIATICGIAFGLRGEPQQLPPPQDTPLPQSANGYIHFTGGESPGEGAAHINPTRAQVFAESEYGAMSPIEWYITPRYGATRIASGAGGVVDDELELLVATTGEYMLVFRVQDPSGPTFRLGSNFVID